MENREGKKKTAEYGKPNSKNDTSIHEINSIQFDINCQNGQHPGEKIQ